ncbi:MAG: tRNA preQ1(34) S-adenosylmethionine ribosyltransferase-isomerase QueA [Erysipelotrichaceae bacterium]|nr:tRNA preQ1(34) S-adenosylmethionine ribosyltransferase-isomerase QueA [Erysipelotrichaceae bacterium]
MDIELFDFDLPEELIAQSPAKKRDESRLMVVNKDTQTIEHKHFYDIIDYLHAGDVLVRNNTKVIPARLIGEKEETHAHVELLLLKQNENDVWECLVGNAKTVKVGTIVTFGNGALKAKCVEIKEEGIRMMQMIYSGVFYEVLDRLGKMPLPPYIQKQCEDNSRYQTVYARIEGSAAAPTAGFHFTEELFEKLKQKGVIVVDVTLHIGLGTFRPVKVKDVMEHHMHSEFYIMTQETADVLNKAKQEHRRIISVGTTSTRVLESVMQKYGMFKACSDNTSIFIYPGYKYLAIDGLITNFHLPKSTLIMLVSALAGREFILKCYNEAVKERYRFFSFGDAMFIYGKEN